MRVFLIKRLMTGAYLEERPSRLRAIRAELDISAPEDRRVLALGFIDSLLAKPQCALPGEIKILLDTIPLALEMSNPGIAGLIREFILAEYEAALKEKGSVSTQHEVNENKVLLDSFVAAFNRHDIDGIMDMFDDHAVFVTWKGDMYKGKEAIRGAFKATFKNFSDAQWTLVTLGNQATEFFGVSNWIHTYTENGVKKSIEGIDHIVFKGGKILRKNTFRKNSF